MARCCWSFLLTAAMMLASFSAQAATYESYPTALLQALNKISGKVSPIEIPIDHMVQFGTLQITVKTCRKTVPEDEPESAAFLEITDLKPETSIPSPVFSGWMFASSPALSALQHPVYDVWVLDCKGTPSQAPPQPQPAPQPLANTNTVPTDSQPAITP